MIGQAALSLWAKLGPQTPRGEVISATRYALEELEALHPGRSVEVRVPPAGAVQAFGGPSHTRGTPPNVVECRPETFLALALGRVTWYEVVHRPIDKGGVQASGVRANLSQALPFLRVRD